MSVVSAASGRGASFGGRAELEMVWGSMQVDEFQVLLLGRCRLSVELSSSKPTRFDHRHPSDIFGPVASANHQGSHVGPKVDGRGSLFFGGCWAACPVAERVLDESSWAADRELRRWCLRQLQQAVGTRGRRLRAELVAEVGAPARSHTSPSWKATDGATPIAMMDTFAWQRALADTIFFALSHRMLWREPADIVGGIEGFDDYLNIETVGCPG